ncbi:MAG: TatD family hydrolase [Polyangiaceae bacterium]|nr:TatD family hydrolase [Polyangiaceae bacterium]
MGLFDVHAHLTSPRFEEPASALIERAEKAGLTTIISNGLNIQDNQATLALAQKFSIVRPALGLYPVDAVLPEMEKEGVDYPREDACVATAEETIEWLENHIDDAFAIGEIGLDHHWVPESCWHRQEEIFRQLVQVAMKADLPIIIHTRKAERRAFEILSEMKAPRVNWHCYSSRLKLARKIAEAGHFLSIPANARRSETFTGMLRTLPRQQVLLETDCPYLSPTPGTLNEPQFVAQTLEYAAELWGETKESAQEIVEDNFVSLFGTEP